MVSRPRHGLSLCAGGGGLDLGLMLAEPGFHTRCFVEWEEYPRSVLIAAQRAGYFAPAPIWDDVTTFDGRPFRGAIDTILAGYPCQPFSHAGKRKGADDKRHLWPEVARIIREVEPRWVFLENVAGHVSLGAETVLRELWDLGWTPAAGLFSASETGAPHQRLRWFCVAYRDNGMRPLQSQGRERDEWGWIGDGRADVGHPARLGCGEGRAEHDVRIGRDTATGSGGTMADAGGAERQGKQPGQRDACGWQEPDGYPALPGGAGLFPPGPGDAAAWAAVLRSAPDMAPAAAARDLHAWARNMEADGREWWQAAAEPEFRRLVDGLADRSSKLRLLGNGVVPLSAAYAWRSLSAAHGLGRVDMEAAECRAEAGANRDVRRMMK